MISIDENRATNGVSILFQRIIEHQKSIRTEFNIIIDGKKIFSDVIYAKDEEDTIKVKTILGETKESQNCKIIEVDVNSARLILKKVEK